MTNEFYPRRDFSLKPRKAGKLSPKKLERILSGIYPEETVADLMKKLCDEKEQESTSPQGNAHKN